MKAITPVIATVMLMLITVGVVGVTYTWFSNMMTTQTEKNIAIPVGGIQCINNRISAIVTNTGANSNITDDDIVIADVNGVSVRNTPFFGGFNTNGLVGYWRFEGDARDSSGNGYDGSVTGATQTSGKFGNAYSFDGNDYITVGTGSSLNFGTNDFTILAWVKTSGGAFTEEHIFSKRNVNGYYFTILNSDGKPRFYASGTGFGAVSANKAVKDNIWHMVVAVRTSSAVQFYKEGAADGNPSITYGDISNSAAVGYIGAEGTAANLFNGVIDEVAIWNRALTPDEVTQLNKTNAGNFTMAPNRAITLINRYPVSAKGKYTVRVGTRNGVIERTVECL